MGSRGAKSASKLGGRNCVIVGNLMGKQQTMTRQEPAWSAAPAMNPVGLQTLFPHVPPHNTAAPPACPNLLSQLGSSPARPLPTEPSSLPTHPPQSPSQTLPHTPLPSPPTPLLLPALPPSSTHRPGRAALSSSCCCRRRLPRAYSSAALRRRNPLTAPDFSAAGPSLGGSARLAVSSRVSKSRLFRGRRRKIVPDHGEGGREGREAEPRDSTGTAPGQCHATRVTAPDVCHSNQNHDP